MSQTKLERIMTLDRKGYYFVQAGVAKQIKRFGISRNYVFERELHNDIKMGRVPGLFKDFGEKYAELENVEFRSLLATAVDNCGLNPVDVPLYLYDLICEFIFESDFTIDRESVENKCNVHYMHDRLSSNLLVFIRRSKSVRQGGKRDHEMVYFSVPMDVFEFAERGGRSMTVNTLHNYCDDGYKNIIKRTGMAFRLQVGVISFVKGSTEAQDLLGTITEDENSYSLQPAFMKTVKTKSKSFTKDGKKFPTMPTVHYVDAMDGAPFGFKSGLRTRHLGANDSGGIIDTTDWDEMWDDKKIRALQTVELRFTKDLQKNQLFVGIDSGR